MKIKNENVTIKIGNKEKKFHNLILDSYIDTYAQSFLEFKDKFLAYCFVKLDTMQEISETSTSMDYDLVLETDYLDTEETYSENTVINKYSYKNIIENKIGDLNSHKITGIGFGLYDETLQDYKLFAFLDVSDYNVIIQEGQKVSISRTDKVTSDLLFYCSDKSIKYPLHLTTSGKKEIEGNNYNTVFSRLYSVGLGTLYNHIEKEILIADLDFKKEGLGSLTITGAKDFAVYPSPNLFPSTDLYPGRPDTDKPKLIIEPTKEINSNNFLESPIESVFSDKDLTKALYPNKNIYVNPDLYPQKAITRWVIYKFQLYRKRYEGEEEIIEPLNQFYTQSQYTELIEQIKLRIKYERG